MDDAGLAAETASLGGEMRPVRRTTKMSTLRQKARRGLVEVEDVLGLVISGSARDVEPLRRLAEESEWSGGPGGVGNPVPLATWAEVVSVFLEGGYSSVDSFARDARSLDFTLGLLAELKTAECVDVLNHLAERFDDPESREKLAATLNLVCSFKGAPSLSADAQARARSWLHGLLKGPVLSQTTAACALRGVGDLESVALLSKLNPFDPPWEGVNKVAVRAIRKRLGPA